MRVSLPDRRIGTLTKAKWDSNGSSGYNLAKPVVLYQGLSRNRHLHFD